MKKIVWMVIISVVLSGPVWAAEPQLFGPKSESVAAKSEPGCVETADDWWRLTADQQHAWTALSKSKRTAICQKVGKTALLVTFQQQKTSEPVSRKLGMAGAIVALGGLVMIVPHGEEYHILGDTYCVSGEGHYVDYGGCGPDPQVAKVGLVVIGAGALMMWAGLRHKTVTIAVTPWPVVSPEMKGARVTVKW